MKGLFKRKNGEFWYYQPPTIKGFDRPGPVALRTVDEIEAINLATEILHGGFQLAIQTQDTLEVIIPRYLAAKSDSRKKTREQREGVLGLFKDLTGNPRITDINKQMIQDWRVRLATTGGTLDSVKPLSVTSCTSYLIVVRAFLNWCVKERLIRKSPAADLGKATTVRAKRREVFLTIEQRDRLLARSCPDYIGLILHLGFYAGLRVGEMLALKPSWLYIAPDWSHGTIRVQETPIEFVDGTKGVWAPKTERGFRTLQIHPVLLAFLKEYGLREPFLLAPHKPLFPNDDTKSLRFDPKKAMLAHGALCGVSGLGFHILRHSFATHLAMGGMNATELSAMLGNSPQVAQDSYMGFSPRRDNAFPGL